MHTSFSSHAKDRLTKRARSSTVKSLYFDFVFRPSEQPSYCASVGKTIGNGDDGERAALDAGLSIGYSIAL